MSGISPRGGASRSAKLHAKSSDELPSPERQSCARLFFHVAEVGMLGLARNLRSRLGNMRAFGLRYRTCHVTSVLADETAAEIDELWHRCAKRYVGGAERDSCSGGTNHPLHHDLVYMLRCPYHLDAIMIARHDAVESVLVNYCGPAQDRDLMAEIGAHVVADLARRQTVRIRAETTHSQMVDALEYIGFVRARRRSAAGLNGSRRTLAGFFLDEDACGEIPR